MGESTTSAELPGVFPVTQWTVVLAAGGTTSRESAAALERLCRAYWYPLYAFVRRSGHAPPDAEDLTQEFFARLLEHNWIAQADRHKGRFRSFLLMAMKRFLANEWDRVHAQKRGGGQAALPLDTHLAERRYQTEAAAGTSPDQVFERRWALSLLEQALGSLRQEFERTGKASEYACLKGFLTAGQGEIDYATVAARLGTSAGAARVAVHRFRRRFREVYRQQVAHTVSSPAEIEDEIRHLRAVLSR